MFQAVKELTLLKVLYVPLFYMEEWMVECAKNDEKMNRDFFSIINEIDNRIENILICVANSSSGE